MSEALQKVIELRNAEKFEEALAILETLHVQNPHDPLVNYHYAWTNDRMGRETAAVPYYVAAIENGLSGEDLRGALLGLGSTYRTNGQYKNAVKILRQGMESFPTAPEFPVFLAMALYNKGESKEAVSMLLKILIQVTDNPAILRLKKAIELYAEDLDKVWLE